MAADWYTVTLALRLVLAELDEKTRPEAHIPGSGNMDGAAFDAVWAEVLADPGRLPAVVRVLAAFAAETLSQGASSADEAAQKLGVALAGALDEAGDR
jgi:hypothetical protein